MPQFEHQSIELTAANSAAVKTEDGAPIKLVKRNGRWFILFEEKDWIVPDQRLLHALQKMTKQVGAKGVPTQEIDKRFAKDMSR